MPVKSGYRVGAGFGATGSWSRYHTGQDFPAPSGTKIYAAASGIVLSPTSGSWAGINVVIQHSDGSTLYAHMSKRVVKPGQAVKAGQLIGYVGNTGNSYGPHLHFEYYKPGVTPGDVYSASNPISFLRGLGVI
nr:M23 family metallopeptidase [Tessaracoccus sp. OS52]